MDREAILKSLLERIRSFAASRIEAAAADDLAQETLLVLHQKYPHLDSAPDLVPLAFQILRFKLAAYLRKRHRRREHLAAPLDQLPLPSPDANPEHAALAAERRRLLLEAFAQLGERCRELLRLKLAGHSFESIRAHFGAASVNTVYTWDLRCRNQLKQSLRPMWGGPA